MKRRQYSQPISSLVTDMKLLMDASLCRMTRIILCLMALEPIIVVSGASTSNCRKERDIPSGYSCIYCGPGSEDLGTINCNYHSTYHPCSKDCYCNTYEDKPDICFDLSSYGNASSGGLIAGVVIGVIVIFVAIGIWCYCCHKRRQFRQTNQDVQNNTKKYQTAPHVTAVPMGYAMPMGHAAVPVQNVAPTTVPTADPSQTQTIYTMPDGSKRKKTETHRIIKPDHQKTHVGTVPMSNPSKTETIHIMPDGSKRTETIMYNPDGSKTTTITMTKAPESHGPTPTTPMVDTLTTEPPKANKAEYDQEMQF